MSKRFYFIVFCLNFVCSSLEAQQFIKGKLYDNLNNKNLQNASVSIISAKDSILKGFTRTKEDGSFSISASEEGKYILLITYPEFVDYGDYVTMKKGETIDLGQIDMNTRTHVLSEFVLRQKLGSIKVSGDSTFYNADSFKVKENATVEDLLKKLPGLQVDKNGQVTAQGEKVQKILVDGEEFFSDDPAVVTKNLQAKTIDQVQVYDKKSDQTEFTGIDDGQKTKTINLKMKEKFKKGFFGKLAIGAGPSGTPDVNTFYENQGMINYFRGKKQLSAFAIIANTGKIGLGWQDQDKYGSGGRVVSMDEDGYMTGWDASDDGGGWQGTYNGQGLPEAYTGGLHFADKWGENDKNHATSNYRYSKQNLGLVNNDLIQNNVPGSVYFSNNHETSTTNGERHRIDGLYEWKIDTNNTIKLTANAGYSNNITHKINTYEKDTLRSDGSYKTSYSSSGQSDNNTTTKNETIDLNWKKKFSKKGRTLMVDVNQYGRTNDGTMNYKLINDLVSLPTDQNKTTKTNQTKYQLTTTYTEPLSKKLFLQLDYALTQNNNSAEKLSFDNVIPSNIPIDSLSSNYIYNVLTNNAGAKLRYVYKKFKFAIGGNVAHSDFKQTDKLHNDTSRTRSYLNFFPKANFNYSLGKQKDLSFNYSGSTTQPTLDEIQPLHQNTDPTNIAIGNPNLKPSFTNYFNLRYHDYKVMSNVYKYLGANFSFVNNAIVQAQSLTQAGKQYSYINLNNKLNYSGSLNAGTGFGIKKTDLRMNIYTNFNTSSNTNFINSIANTSKNNSLGLTLDFNYDKDKKYNIKFEPSLEYNNTYTTVNQKTTQYYTSDNELEITYYLPWKLELGTTANYYWRQKTVGFDQNNNVFTWDASVSRKFLKGDQLEIKAAIFDILNQNKGFSRYENNGAIQQNTYSTIRQYGLLSAIWNFSSNKQPASDDHGPHGKRGGGMRRMMH